MDKKVAFQYPGKIFDIAKIDGEFSDVTLVSDDLQKVSAHRLVISEFSPVLKDILLSTSQTNPIIFLKGIKHTELLSILMFIYHAEVKVDRARLQDFLIAASDLKVKSIIGNFKESNEQSRLDMIENPPWLDCKNKVGENCLKTPKILLNSEEKNPFLKKRRSLITYNCNDCEEIFNYNTAFVLHKKTRHGVPPAPEAKEFQCDTESAKSPVFRSTRKSVKPSTTVLKYFIPSSVRDKEKEPKAKMKSTLNMERLNQILRKC